VADPRSHETEREERVEELVEDAREENPDPTTRRETFELDLMEEGLVEEGREVQVNRDDESEV
jgi:hypothetical protein